MALRFAPAGGLSAEPTGQFSLEPTLKIKEIQRNFSCAWFALKTWIAFTSFEIL
jgi:hypothetical protein